MTRARWRRIPRTLAWAVVAAACRHAPEEVVETSAVVGVAVEPAERATVAREVSATATVQPEPGADIIVTAPQAARIVALPLAVGEHVRRGELVARFDIPTAREDLATRRGELGQARARLENARKNQARLAGLLERGIASRKEVEDASREVAEAEAAVRQGEGTHAAAADLAAQATVTAPFDALVVERWHNPGDVVDVNEHVLRLVDPQRLQVVAAVAAGDLARIASGRAVRVRPASGEVVTGVVAGGPGAVDPATGTAPVRIRVRTPLPAGTPVSVDITAEERPDVVSVPAAAVVREDDATFVYVVGADGIARRRRVTLGLAGAERVEVARGIAPGEPVIVRGQRELPDGAKVTIEKRESP